MPLYRITAPNGQTYQIEGPDGASDAEVAQAVLAQYPEAGQLPQAPKQSTIGSEFVRGAKQLGSSTLTGLQALVGSPEEAAQRGVARGQAISEAAGEGPSFEAVKKAYEDKGLLSAAGEAVSQIPRALAGQGAQLGTMAAGARLGAMAGSAVMPGAGTVIGGALGAGATLLPQFFGSNVERQAAEQMERGEDVSIDRTKAGMAAAGQAAIEGAGTAFTLGKRVVKGVLGIADDAVLSTAKAQKELVKAAERSLSGTVARGAARGMTEIPVEVAQQVIERAQAGLDLTSEDALKEYGESAYQAALIGGPLGGAGNVVDRSGARAKLEAQRREQATMTPPEAPAPEAPAQGELFTPEEMGVGQAPKQEEPAATQPAPAVPQAAPTQQDLGLDYQREVEDLFLERERLKAAEQTPETTQRIADLSEQIKSYLEMDFAEKQAQKAQDAEQARQDERARERFPALANAPELMAQSDEVKARTQGELFPAEELGGRFEGPQKTEPTEAAKPTQPTPVPPYKRTGPYQYKLPLRGRAGEITMQNLMDIGLPMRTSKQWLEQNVVGKTRAEIADMIAKDPSLTQGRGARALILRELTAPEVKPFKEAPSAPTAPVSVAQERPEPRASEPSVAVPSEPATVQPPAAGKPDTQPAGRAQGPVSSGLVPAGKPVGQRDAPQGAQPAAVKEEPKARKERTVKEAPLPEEPTTPAVQQLEKAKTLAEFNAAMDRLVEIQQSKAHPEKEAVGEFIGANERHPAFAKAFEAAVERARKKPQAPAKAAPAERDIEEAPKKVEAAPRKNDAYYEPIGINKKTGKIIRGPQQLLQPIDDKTAKAYLEERATRKEEDAITKMEELPSKPKKDERQLELDFNAPVKEEPAEVVEAFDQKALKALEGASLVDAAKWASENLTRPDYKVIAQRVLVKLQQLQSLGAVLKPVQITKEGYALTGGARGRTIYEAGRAGSKSSIEIILNHPSNGENSGVVPETILHELLHAATLGTIELGKRRSAAGSKVGDATRELLKVGSAAIAHFNARVKEGDANLTEFEKRIYRGLNNAMNDEHEILVWSLTNKDMQEYMESIPYQGQTLWNKFVTLIRDMLGIPAKADTALSELLRVGDTILGLTKEDIQGAEKQVGKQFQVSVGTEALIDSMGPLDANQSHGLKRLIDGVKTLPEGVSYATKFRTQYADSAATIEHRLREKFDGAVRDSLGNVNPMGLYRQAQDYSKMLLEYFQTGTLVKDKDTKMWRAETGEGVRAPAKVYELIDKWAAKNGYSRERGTQIASRILEGVRLDAMRKANQTEGTSFLIHLKDNEIDQLVAEYKADKGLQEMSKLMDEARMSMIDNMVKVGRLTAEQGKLWKASVGYVPFDRIDDFAAGFSKVKKISGKGLAQLGKLPELVGSLNRPVGNVFDNYLNTLGWMVGQTMKSDATLQTLRALEDLGQAKFLGRSTQQLANTVGAYVDGEMMYWELPSKYDLMAFKDLTPPKAGWMRAFGEASNILRKAVTILPPFALKQVTDDVQRAILTSGVKNPGALLRMTLTNFPKLAMAELRGIQHPVVKEFGAMGLTGEYDFQAGKPATSLLKDLGYKPRGKVEKLLHKLDGVTRASDLAVRAAIYEQTLKETNDQLLAQTRAREFINFRRRGASELVGAATTMIPFFNAYVQGMDVLYRAASGIDSSSSVNRAQARRLFWSRAIIATTLSSMYALGKGDDEDYADMDLRTRDSNWILPGGFKIPVPGELGAIFKVIPERVVEYMRRSGTPEEQEAFEAVRTALSYMYEQYVGRVTPVPQAVKPLIEIWANKSFLTGRPLEGYHHQQLDPSMRRTEGTSEMAVAIANFSRAQVGVEVSPIMIDNALRGYFGSTAALLTTVTDSLLNPTRADRPLHKWALLSNYMYDPVGTRRMTEFYEARDEVMKANVTLKELMKTDIDRAVTYAEEHADELMLESAINSTLQQLENTRAYRKFLNSKDGADLMDSSERADQLKEIKEMEVQLTAWLREAKTAIRKSH
jgi:hypothetical protein